MFIQNKYTKWYYSIIERSVTEPGIGLEKHHIIPNSFYIQCSGRSKIGWLDGNPDDPSNIAYLTIREHRLCHLLLVRMTKGAAKHKMLMAARLMINTRAKKYGLSKGRCFEQIKLECAELARAYKHTDDARAKQSAANKGRKHNVEWIENNRQAQLKRAPMSDETKEKLRVAMTGRVMSEEWKQKISAAQKGRILSEDHRAKLSISAKGRVLSEEHKAKINPKGRKHSAETKEKIRLARLGSTLKK